MDIRETLSVAVVGLLVVMMLALLLWTIRVMNQLVADIKQRDDYIKDVQATNSHLRQEVTALESELHLLRQEIQ